MFRDVTDPSAELQMEVGVFVAATVVLTGFTLAVTFWWVRKGRKVAPPVAAQMALQAGLKQERKAV